MMEIIKLMLYFLVPAIIGGTYQMRRVKKKKNITLNSLQAMKRQLKRIPTQEMISADNKYILSIDENTQKINFTTEQSNKTYDIKDILETQIINHVSTSDETTTRKTRSGDLSSSTITHKTVSQIEMRFTVNDTETPFYSIFFLYSPFSMKYGHPYVEKATKEINHWNAIINIMRAGTTEQVTPSQINNHESVADELVKITNLLQQGILTQEEYNTLKAKLIS
ncbi:hypothetical protein ACP8HI_01645 [Paenibacillus sp. FA6]|uniref:SHOCT domain-containing protein n=1 Tax=Paenibacillus sp. FA6 TaxID=3413029 RepID=UPI003F65D644